jgi:hypothetical protein
LLSYSLSEHCNNKTFQEDSMSKVMSGQSTRIQEPQDPFLARADKIVGLATAALVVGYAGYVTGFAVARNEDLKVMSRIEQPSRKAITAQPSAPSPQHIFPKLEP